MSSKIFGTLVTTVGIQALGLVSGILLARFLGVQGRGELATVILWPSILAYLGDIGGPNAYVFQSSSSPSILPSLISNIVPIVALQSATLYLLGTPLIWFATTNTPGLRGITYSFMVLYVPINLLTRYFHGLNQGLGHFRYFNAVRFGVQATYVIGVVVVWVAGFHTVAAVIIVTILSNVFALGIAFFGTRPGLHQLWAPDSGLAKETFAYGLRAHLGNVNPIDSLRLDFAFVAGFLGSRDLGLYSVASSVANLIRAIGGSLGMVAMPGVAGASGAEERASVTHRILRLCFLLAGALAAVVIAAAPWAVPFVYGSGFSGAVPVTQVLTLGMVAAAMRQVLADCLRGGGNPLSGSIAEVVSWVILAIGIILLLPPFGLIGVAVTVAVSYAASFLACFWLGRSSLSLSLASMIPRPSDIFRIASLIESQFISRWRRNMV